MQITHDYISTGGSNTNEKIGDRMKRYWLTFHNFFIVGIIFTIIGIGIGVKSCEYFYKIKMSESITLGGLIYDKKVYNISIK